MLLKTKICASETVLISENPSAFQEMGRLKLKSNTLVHQAKYFLAEANLKLHTCPNWQ
jgi:hypothetical protein